MRSYTIGVIPGDGIGLEVIQEGLKILAELEDFQIEQVHYPYSGEYYLKTKELVPETVIDEWRQLDAVLLGAIGHPDVEPGLVERSVILGLRFGLDLYINLRPIKLYAEHLCPIKGKTPKDIDFVVVRENTEGLYSQIGGHLKARTEDEVNEGSTKRKPKVTLVDKSNAIRPQDIWTRAFKAVSKDFLGVETDHAYVDACCMWMIKNPQRQNMRARTSPVHWAPSWQFP
jgi:3-isopropylmalate dehydrogenase